MTRYRALRRGQPLAPWRARRDLAEQDSVEAGEAYRDLHSAIARLSPGATIEEDGGEATMTPDQDLWAEAIQVLKMKGDQAAIFVAQRMKALEHDRAGWRRWNEIGRRVRQLRDAMLRRQ